MERLVIACMDRRLNKYLDSLNDGKTVFLRNAGGDARALARSIRYVLNNHNIRRIHVVVHTDCGAMKVVVGARDKSLKVSDDVMQNLVSHFDSVKYKDRAELEQANEKLQKAAMTEMTGGGVEITSELVDVSKLDLPKGDGKHVLAITRSSDQKYERITGVAGSDLVETYTVQADSIDEVMHDIEIAIGAIGIHDVKVIALDSSEYRQLLFDTNKLKAKPFVGKDVHVDYIKA